jgi:tetratricopeptide (TPR) repeat protein
VRRARRQAAIAGVLVAALFVMTGLTLYAFASRAEAVKERDIARRKTMTAERTVAFVKGLFQVADPSESRGDTITAREILDRGAHQIQVELSDEPSVKAELSTTLGEVYAELGLYRQGEALIQQTLPLRNVDPSTRARQYAALGEAQGRQGDDDGAVVSFTKALAVAASDPNSETNLASRALVGLGMAQSELNQYAKADGTLRRALAIDTRAAGAASPDVARDLEELAYNDVRIRHYDQARTHLDRALAIRIAAQGGRHPKVSEDLSSLGVVAYFQGDANDAEHYYRRAMAADAAILGPDHPDAVTTVNSYARLLLERRDYAEANRLLEHVVAVVLRQRSDTFEDLAYELDNLGLAKAGLGDERAAEALFTRALRVARLHNHRNLAPILADLADVTCAHDPAAGLALLEEAGPIMANAYPNDPWRSAWVTTMKGRCRLAAGDRAGARGLLMRSHPIIRARWPANSLYGKRADSLLAEAS